MKTLLVGHRGTGKSALLARLELYLTEESIPCRLIDLDRQIECDQKLSVDEIFRAYGEAEFRKMEIRALQKIAEETKDFEGPVVVASGAGFEGAVPSGWKCIWIRRPSDTKGRVFTDRPRLSAQTSPLTEFLDRAEARGERYLRLCHHEFLLSEGFDKPNPIEKDFLLERTRNCGGVITLLPERLQEIPRLLRMGVGLIELRDDLLSEKDVREILSAYPADRFLYSFRNSDRVQRGLQFISEFSITMTDWALELGKVPSALQPKIVSVHAVSSLEKLEELSHEYFGRAIVKVAIPIASFRDLARGHRWVQASSHDRVFLPMSADGRWAWYRLRMKNLSAFNFFREGDGSAPDQPSLYDWLRTSGENHFAAVLGFPVGHSRTPGEHAPFFSTHRMDVFAIPLSSEDLRSGALAFLQELGMTCAAVTAPLKIEILSACTRLTETARVLQSVNTIALEEDSWIGHNTDIDGFRFLAKEVGSGTTVLWGGGGTLGVMSAVVHHAISYSARTGLPRGEESTAQMAPSKQTSPDIVIWAVGRDQMGACQFPRPEWKPLCVVDLNYAEDSPGREYAQRVGAKYISGLGMFSAQASAQREFWRAHVGK